MKKTILFVDNNEEFLDVHAKLLENRGYRVLRATSAGKAEGQLQKFSAHLAILDIRLEDDNDEHDISGLTLAQNKAFHYLPKIMLTAYPSWQYAKMALGASTEGLNLVEIIAKDDGVEQILTTVDKAFANHVPINWSLIIRRSDTSLLTISHIVASIAPSLYNYPQKLDHVLRDINAGK